MAASKRVSSKQKLDSVLEGFEKVVDIQNKHNKEIRELLSSVNTLSKKVDKMIDLLQKAGEVELEKEWPKEKEGSPKTKSITFSDL